MKRIPMAIVGTALLVAAPMAGAQDQKIDGVRAELQHGTLQIRGGDQPNVVALRLKSGDPTVIQVDVGNDASPDFSFARSQVEAINVKMGDGNDVVRVDDANGAVDVGIPTTISGGDGNDSLTGGQGAETFRGGDGDDFALGGKGADTGIMGAGDDTFRWDNGDGSDVVEGQDGTDTMLFNGAQGAETTNLSANGERLKFFRQQGNVTMDTDDVEVVDVHELGGQDNITVGDLSGTDVKQTNIDLAAALGGSAGDLVADTVTVKGTEGDDDIAVSGNGSGADVTGLASSVSVTHADPDKDVLAVDTRAGNDHVAVSGVAGLIQLLVDGVPSS
ncbi:MAG TPA: hypothetical protein VF066_02400 [Thermoleophilaceae bacterium]